MKKRLIIFIVSLFFIISCGEIKQKDVDIKEIAKISYKKGILNDT